MGAYLSARESADYCGVSEKTIRNWIASGRLSAEKSAGSFRIAQEELDVLRSGSPHRLQGAESASAEVRTEGGPQGAEGAAESAGVVELVSLVRHLQAQLVTRTEAATLWQARAEMLAERLAAAESRILALSAPESPVEAPGAPEPPDPTTGAVNAVVATLERVARGAGARRDGVRAGAVTVRGERRARWRF